MHSLRFLMLPAVCLMACAQVDPFAGTFSDGNLGLEIKLAPNGAYTGRLRFQGSTFPVIARRAGDGLKGTFTSDGSSFEFQVRREQGSLVLVTDGTEYRLKSTSAAAPNPLTSASASTPNPVTAASRPAGDTPSNLRRHELGFAVRLPAGWTAQDNPQGMIALPPGVVFDQSREDNPEVYVIGVNDQFQPGNEEAIVRELSSAMLQAGAQVTRADRQPFRAGSRNGSAFTWDFRQGDAVPRTLRIFVVPEGSRAYLVMAAGRAEAVQSRQQQVLDIAGSFQRTSVPTPQGGAPQGGALADNTPEAQMWLAKLRGKVIKQFISGGGVVGERTRYLAPDGTYSMRGSSAVSIDVGQYGQAPDASAGAIMKQNQSGRWKIRDTNGRIFLQITDPDGSVRMLPITKDSRNWYLNGEKAFAVNP